MRRAPHRLKRRAARALGVCALLAPVALLACEPREIPDGSNPPDSLLQAVLGLPPTAHVHRIVLTGRGAEERVVPVQLDIAPGDYVEFYVADGRVHTLAFAVDSLSEEARAFLRSTGQGASPPLLERGARFVLTFEGAPGGRYPYRSMAHGDTVDAVIQVRGGDAPGRSGG